jgi:predicted PilT family ATPase
MQKNLTWLLAEKQNYALKVTAEGKELQDKSVEELDENLRKQWPRKGRLEVEVYQERKAQVSAHNKKYERHVRTQLEKYNMLEDQWHILLDTIEQEFKAYQEKNAKLKAQLPTGKNLAMLQGMSRREKDSQQIFEEKCSEFQD